MDGVDLYSEGIKYETDAPIESSFRKVWATTDEWRLFPYRAALV